MPLLSYKADLLFGAEREKCVLPIINSFFKDDAVATDEVYSTQDFVSCKFVYELKSRRIKHRTYPTAIIGCNKAVLKTCDREKILIFLFNYTDGLFYIKYDKAVFDEFNTKLFCRGNRLNYNDKASMVYDIPIDKLIRIF